MQLWSIGLAGLAWLACSATVWGQRMQFPTQVPLEAAPTPGPAAAPALVPAPGATFQGSITPPAGWDPYGTPGTDPAVLLPQDPTLPAMPGLPTGPVGTQRLLQSLQLDYHYLLGHGEQELGINDIEASATFAFPFFYNAQYPLLVRPGFGLHLFEGPQSPAWPDLPPWVYDAFLEAGWKPQITPWLGADLAFRVGIYTDPRWIGQESLRYTGHGYAVLAFSPSFQIKAGVEYLDRVKVKIIPAGGVIWTPNPDIRFDILFPSPRIARRLSTMGNTDWWIYGRGEYGGGSWTIMHDFVPPGTPEVERIDYNDIRVAVGLEFRGLRGTTGYFEVGGAFDREVIYRDQPIIFRPNNTLLLGAGLIY